MVESRVFIIGLDGGSWDIIKPLAEKGVLPNLEGLMRESAWGTLESTVPPVTCPAWFTFSTGMRPSHLGIYGFRGMPHGSNQLRYHSYKDLDYPETWDLLTDAGYTCGIINDPLVYPRRDNLAYIVPGFITPQEDLRTHPAGLMQDLDRVCGEYEIDQFGSYLIDDQTLQDGCARVVGKRVKAMSYLMRECPTDFFLGIFTSTDRIAHRFLNRALLGDEGQKERGWEAIEAVYSRVDDGIGRLLSMVGEEDYLLLVSDHGFAARPWNVYINQILVDEDLLKIKVRGTMEKIGLTQRNVGSFLNRLGLVEKVYRITPEKFRTMVPAGESIYGEYFIHELERKGRLDWSRTRALCLGNGIYLNSEDRPHGSMSRREAEAVKKRIRQSLESLKDPDGGDKGIEVHEPREIYGEDVLVDPPDLVLVGRGDWEVMGTINKSGSIFSSNQRAGHAMEGIFLLRHPWAVKGELPGHLGIEDIAPLVLHILDVPIPDSFDGGVDLGIFEADAPVAREERRVKVGRDATALEKERIKRGIASLKEKGIL
jgi:predicted AlkP superfamily phosphohydrolase/phosphomutase